MTLLQAEAGRIRTFHRRILSAGQARLQRLLARRRPPWIHGGFEIRLAPPAPVADPVWFGLALSGAPARVALSRLLLASLLSGLDAQAPQADGAVTPLLLELALEPLLARLEGAGLAVTLCPDPGALAGPSLALSCHVGSAAGADRVAIEAGPDAGALIMDLLSRAPMRRERLPGLVVAVHLRTLVTDLDLDTLRTVCMGDVILAESAGEDMVLAVAGERLAWRARRQGRTLHIESARLTARTASLEGWTLSDATQDGGEDELGQIPVRLTFELGRLELPLGELETLGPGHVFELARDEQQPVDILANGRRIGRGQVVSVAGSIGVQVVWIGRHE